jgi:hypothetical protein
MKRSPSSCLVFTSSLPLVVTLALGCAGGPDANGGAGEPAAREVPASSASPTEPGRTADASAPAPNSPRSACETYLSCLLAVTPTAYGAAVQLYGEGAACWATAAQSDGCGKACDAAFDQIAKQCSCKGTQCTKCEFPYGSYNPSAAAGGDCGTTPPWSLDVTNGAEGPALRVRFDQYESIELPLACTSPATFTRSVDRGCPVEWTGSVSSSGSSIVVTGTKKTTCPGDAPRTCSFKWNATKVR